MNRLIGGLFAGFALLMGATMYIAHRSYEGLVDRRYHEAGSNEFAEREAEAREGFTATFTDGYRAGNNRFRAVLSTTAGPLPRRTSPSKRCGSGAPGTIARSRSGRSRPAPTPPTSPSPSPVNGSSRSLWTRTDFAPGDGGRPSRCPRARRDRCAGPPEARRFSSPSFSPWPPRAMREVEITVSLPGYAGAAAPRVDLSMAGMEMGRNRVDLSRGPDGRYRGTGVIVQCPSGRNEWEATVTAPGAGKAVFRFAVAD